MTGEVCFSVLLTTSTTTKRPVETPSDPAFFLLDMHPDLMDPIEQLGESLRCWARPLAVLGNAILSRGNAERAYRIESPMSCLLCGAGQRPTTAMTGL